jgi:hypothetical protein
MSQEPEVFGNAPLDHPGRSRARAAARIADAPALEGFLVSRAAFAAQKVTVEYCRARAGIGWRQLTSEAGFAAALETCRWEAFAAVYPDVAETCQILLRQGGAPAEAAGPGSAPRRGGRSSPTPSRRTGRRRAAAGRRRRRARPAAGARAARGAARRAHPRPPGGGAHPGAAALPPRVKERRPRHHRERACAWRCAGSTPSWSGRPTWPGSPARLGQRRCRPGGTGDARSV